MYGLFVGIKLNNAGVFPFKSIIDDVKLRHKCLILFDLIIYVPSTIFQLCRAGLPGLNQYYARINMSCSRTHCSDAGEARTRGPLVLSQAFYH